MAKPFPARPIRRLRFTPAVSDHIPEFAAAPLAWAALNSGCRLGRIHLFASSGGVSAVAPVRLGVLTRDRPAAPKQSAKPGTTGKHITTGPMERMRATGRLS